MRLQLTGLVALSVLTVFESHARADVETNPMPDPRADTSDETSPEPAPTSAPPATKSGGDTAARVSFETSGYADTDHVSVFSPTIAGTVGNVTQGWELNARYLVDVVSAASVDIVSTASSRWHEVRNVGSGSASYQRGSVEMSLSGGVSREPDYLSIGGGGRVTLDMLDKNLTPYFGLSYTHNEVGRTGLASSRWQEMQTIGLQLGATFIVDKATIASVGLDTIFEWGYLAKPYRSIALFGPTTRVPVGASVDSVNAVRLDEHPPEQLPRTRDRYALTGRIAHRFDHVSLRFDERVYHDAWGLWASTTDARAMWDIGRRLVAWPHVRFHGQNAVDFWQRAYRLVPLVEGTQTLPRYRTGDRELSWLSTITLGGGAKVRLSETTRAPWFLSLDVDFATTRYTDALFITQRQSVFSALTLDTEWE